MANCFLEISKIPLLDSPALFLVEAIIMDVKDVGYVW
jgi:hypothetical protein